MTLPTFIDLRLQDDIERGAQGGPGFLTTVIELISGKEKRNAEWSAARQDWDISYGISNPDDLESVKNLFYNCLGRFIGFRFKDWSDFQIGDTDTNDPTTKQTIGTGNASNTLFQIYKTYTIGPYSFNRSITRPVQGTLLVYVAGVLKTETTDYTADYDTGLITFISAPGNTLDVSVLVEFDIPVRFDTDVLKKTVIWTGAEELPSIPIKELKE